LVLDFSLFSERNASVKLVIVYLLPNSSTHQLFYAIFLILMKAATSFFSVAILAKRGPLQMLEFQLFDLPKHFL